MENSRKPRAVSRSREQPSSRGPFQGRELVTWQTMGSTMTMTAPAYIRHSLLFCISTSAFAGHGSNSRRSPFAADDADDADVRGG